MNIKKLSLVLFCLFFNTIYSSEKSSQEQNPKNNNVDMENMFPKLTSETQEESNKTDAQESKAQDDSSDTGLLKKLVRRPAFSGELPTQHKEIDPKMSISVESNMSLLLSQRLPYEASLTCTQIAHEITKQETTTAKK